MNHLVIIIFSIWAEKDISAPVYLPCRHIKPLEKLTLSLCHCRTLTCRKCGGKEKAWAVLHTFSTLFNYIFIITLCRSCMHNILLSFVYIYMISWWNCGACVLMWHVCGSLSSDNEVNVHVFAWKKWLFHVSFFVWLIYWNASIFPVICVKFLLINSCIMIQRICTWNGIELIS